MIDLDNATDICLSGGAVGADLQWGMTAGHLGHAVIHFGFNGHRSQAPESEIITLTKAQLAEADPHLEKANKTLNRTWPISDYFISNLLRRNYYQVAWSSSLYAISEIDRRGLVKGGTAWAVQMFIDLHPDGKAYVYDQIKKQWYQWKGAWLPIIHPPLPSGVWAGVGTRKLNDDGKAAIRKLMGWQKEPEWTI